MKRLAKGFPQASIQNAHYWNQRAGSGGPKGITD
jgi:hypothetical protein